MAEEIKQIDELKVKNYDELKMNLVKINEEKLNVIIQSIYNYIYKALLDEKYGKESYDKWTKDAIEEEISPRSYFQRLNETIENLKSSINDLQIEIDSIREQIEDE